MLLEPVLEQGVHLPGQAQHDAEGTAGASIGGGLQDALELGLVEERDDRRHAHAHRHTRAGQRFDRAQPALRCRCTRLELARQHAIQRGDRHINGGHVLRGHGRDEVEVALDEARLGDDRKRVAGLRQHLDHLARDAQAALHRLVGIGDGADVEMQRRIALGRQRLAQAFCRIHLGHDARFEVQPGRQVQIAVRGARVAVDAAVFATAVRVDREIKADVGRVVARQDAACVFLEDLRAGRGVVFGRCLLERAPAIVKRRPGICAETMLQGPHRAAALECGGGCKHQRRRGDAIQAGRTVRFGVHTVNIYSLTSLGKAAAGSCRPLISPAGARVVSTRRCCPARGCRTSSVA